MNDDQSDWPKHPDGRNKKIGEMTLEQRRRVAMDACRRLQAELDDPTSSFRRKVEAILYGPEISKATH